MTISKEMDVAVLTKLEELGSDLTKSHPISFFFYFPSEELAKEAAQELQWDGCQTEVAPKPVPWWKKLFSKPRWACYASKSMTPERQAVLDTTAKFNAIAERLSGEYDGWETEVTN